MTDMHNMLAHIGTGRAVQATEIREGRRERGCRQRGEHRAADRPVIWLSVIQ